MNGTLALGAPAYSAPALTLGTDTAQRQEAIWWVVVVGFAYAVALAWATWCRVHGGSAEVSFGWTGFKVVCRK